MDITEKELEDIGIDIVVDECIEPQVEVEGDFLKGEKGEKGDTGEKRRQRRYRGNRL